MPKEDLGRGRMQKAALNPCCVPCSEQSGGVVGCEGTLPPTQRMLPRMHTDVGLRFLMLHSIF